jgi:hypothetical protein
VPTARVIELAGLAPTPRDRVIEFRAGKGVASIVELVKATRYKHSAIRKQGCRVPIPGSI